MDSASCTTLGGTFMFFNEEDDLLEEEVNDDDEGIELKTISIADYVKLRRAQRQEEQAEFEKKLKVLQEKTKRLKKELGYD